MRSAEWRLTNVTRAAEGPKRKLKRWRRREDPKAPCPAPVGTNDADGPFTERNTRGWEPWDPTTLVGPESVDVEPTAFVAVTLILSREPMSARTRR
jgi:hypothetical protein